MIRSFKVSVLGLILTLVGAQVFAQEAPADETVVYGRGLGSQVFAIDLGLGVPLFSMALDGSEFTGMANLKVGGMGGLKWSAFLNESFALGADLSGFVGEGPNKDAFTAFPIGVRASNYFRINESFQVPVHLGLALNLMRYKDLSYIGIALKPGASFYWDATKDWSFGLNAVWWIVPEFYTSPTSTPPSSQTRVGNFLELTLSALYSFNQ